MIRTIITFIGWMVIGIFVALGVKNAWQWLQGTSPNVTQTLEKQYQQVQNKISTWAQSSSSSNDEQGKGDDTSPLPNSQNSSDLVKTSQNFSTNPYSSTTNQEPIHQSTSQQSMISSSQGFTVNMGKKTIDTPDNFQSSLKAKRTETTSNLPSEFKLKSHPSNPGEDPTISRLERLSKDLTTTSSPVSSSPSKPESQSNTKDMIQVTHPQEDAVLQRQLRLVEELITR